MFSALSEKLEDSFRKLRGLGRISESNVTDAMREIRLALLEADVDFKVTKELINAVKERAMGQDVLRSVTPGQQIVKIFNDELARVLGGGAVELSLESPSRILLAGLNGAGKTTTAAKLANWIKKQGQRPLLVALDLFRPAAIKQLQVLGEQIDVPVWAPPEGEKDPVRAAKMALKWVEEQGGAITIFDTAGRQDLDEGLLDELARLKGVVEPTEVLLVVDAATGQQAVNVASKFHETVSVTGLVMSKLDGDARGGALLSMRQVTGQPVKFLGVGEKVDQFEVFHPDRMAQRILGMGDVVSLVEKAAEQIDEKDAMKMAERFQSAKFDFNDFLSQIRFMKKLGPLEGLMGMMPGMPKMPDMSEAGDRMKYVEAIVLSMTPKERSKPDIINGSRRKRIANGSGRSVMEVNQLMKQFAMMRKMMKKQSGVGKMGGAMLGGGRRKKGKKGKGGMGGFPGMPKMPKGFNFPGKF